MEKIDKKYRSLRMIAWLFKFGAWVSLVCGFVLFFAVLFGGKVLFHMMEGGGYGQYMEFGRAFGSFFVLGGFLLNALFLYAISSTISLFIDLEANTRQIVRLLSRQTPSTSPSSQPRTGDTREIPT